MPNEEIYGVDYSIESVKLYKRSGSSFDLYLSILRESSCVEFNYLNWWRDKDCVDGDFDQFIKFIQINFVLFEL